MTEQTNIEGQRVVYASAMDIYAAARQSARIARSESMPVTADRMDKLADDLQAVLRVDKTPSAVMLDELDANGQFYTVVTQFDQLVSLDKWVEAVQLVIDWCGTFAWSTVDPGMFALGRVPELATVVSHAGHYLLGRLRYDPPEVTKSRMWAFRRSLWEFGFMTTVPASLDYEDNTWKS